MCHFYLWSLILYDTSSTINKIAALSSSAIFQASSIALHNPDSAWFEGSYLNKIYVNNIIFVNSVGKVSHHNYVFDFIAMS